MNLDPRDSGIFNFTLQEQRTCCRVFSGIKEIRYLFWTWGSFEGSVHIKEKKNLQEIVDRKGFDIKPSTKNSSQYGTSRTKRQRNCNSLKVYTVHQVPPESMSSMSTECYQISAKEGGKVMAWVFLHGWRWVPVKV